MAQAAARAPEPIEAGNAAAAPVRGDTTEGFDESFENASPVALSRDDGARGDSAGRRDDGSRPPLEELVQKIPAGTRRTLEELFRAKFTGVRRFDPGQSV